MYRNRQDLFMNEEIIKELDSILFELRGVKQILENIQKSMDETGKKGRLNWLYYILFFIFLSLMSIFTGFV